jgi:Ca2+-binding RTX toxin-like protein
VSGRRSIALLACAALAALTWPAEGTAAHLKTSGTVSARVTERENTDFWVVEITWTATCTGAKPGTAWYGGELQFIDADTGERIVVGGVVDTSGQRSVVGKRETFASSLKRPRTLIPELTVHCYENFPLHGGPEIVVTGAPVIIPPSFGGDRGHGDGNGGGGRGGGGGDPTAPLSAEGCRLAVLGTNGADRLEGSDSGDVMIGFAAGDRLRGLPGHDCLVGGSGADKMDGGDGNDRLTGGSGRDRLVDRKGVNAFDAGSGADFVDARNGRREPVRCGPGFDLVRVDRRDRLRGCERRLR